MSTSFDRPPNKNLVPWRPLAMMLAPASDLTRRVHPLIIVIASATGAVALTEAPNVLATIQSFVAPTPPARIVPQAAQPVVATDASKELAELRAQIAKLQQESAAARTANLPIIAPSAPTPAPIVRLDEGGSGGLSAPPPPRPPTGAAREPKEVAPPPKPTAHKPVAHKPPQAPSMSKAKADEVTSGAHRGVKPAARTPQPHRRTVYIERAPVQQRRVYIYPQQQQQPSFNFPLPIPIPFFGGHGGGGRGFFGGRGGFGGHFGGHFGGFRR